MIQIRKKHLYNLLFFISSVLLLMGPAFENGFPILFSDSGTYLVSGQTDYVPVDRPIIYGLFVRHISLSWSIWLVIISHALIVSFVLLLFFRHFVKAKTSYLFLFITSLILYFFSGIGYYCAQISADIFTSITILGIFLIYFLPKKEIFSILFLCLLIGFSIISHLSHLPISLALVGILFLVELIRKIQNKEKTIKLKRIYALISTIGVSLLILASVNYSYGVGFKLSRASNIVIGARMIESGLANRLLKEKCGTANFHPPYENLCNYVDSFDQWPAAGFYLHVESSPLYDGECVTIDWTTCWTGKDSAYGVLIDDILKEKNLRNDFIAMAIAGTIKQLFIFEQSKIDPQHFTDIFKNYYGDDSFLFETSTQRKNSLVFNSQNIRETILVDLSFLLLLIFFFRYWHTIDYQSKLFALFILVALISNAFICATFSNVVPRYQGRIIFLIPLLLILLVLRYIRLNKNKYNLSLSNFFMDNTKS